MHERTTRPRRVLLVLDPPDGTTRFVDQVIFGLPDSMTVDYFTWRRAFTSRYDVLHVHWPERLTRSSGRLQTSVHRLMLIGLLLRARLLRVAVVRTAHNLKPHESGDRVERWLFDRLDRATVVTIVLNDSTPDSIGGGVRAQVPHGHYRDVFAAFPASSPVPGRLVSFGIIREYKGIERLVEVFRAIPDPGLTLRLVGRPINAFWRSLVEDACAADARISARLEFVPDDVLVSEVTQSELVVLPYKEMHNSGAIFVALSLDRPVVAPRSPVNEELAAEVGPGWVHLYDGELTEDVITGALATSRSARVTARPRFVDRDWTTVGRLHGAVYADAIRRVHAGPRRRRSR